MNFVKTMVALGVCCFAVQGFAADGEINFTGSVTANTCSISASDLNGGAGGSVSLGNVPSTSLAKAGDTSGAGAFELALTKAGDNCDLTDKKATVRFLSLSGTAGQNGQWVGISPGAVAKDAATNVAVQIKDAKGLDVQLGQASSEYSDLTKPMRFTANYIATGKSTPGSANAKASFSIDYK